MKNQKPKPKTPLPTHNTRFLSLQFGYETGHTGESYVMELASATKMMNSLYAIFQDKLLQVNDRLAVVSIDWGNWSIHFLPPNYIFFVQVIFLLLAQMFAGCVVAAIMYFGVVKQSNGPSVQGYLVGYGIYIPLAIWSSFFVMESLDVRSPTLRLGLCSAPMTLPLRCLQTMHGALPDACRESLWNYMVSIGFILRPSYDKSCEPIPLSAQVFGRGVLKYLYWMLLLSVLLCTLYAPFDFHPFHSNVDVQKMMFVYDLPNLYNAFIHLVFMNLSLSLSLTGVALLAGAVTGVQFNDHVTDFPLFFSTSHSEFWGSRWNNMIHNDLKEGVYKPIRSWTGNRVLAAISTFVVSGLQHEHVWWMIFTPTTAQMQEVGDDPNCCLTCFCETWFGRQLFLFSYAGLWMAFEYSIGKLPKFKSTTLLLLESHVFMISLFMPVAHHFTADLVDGGYFTSLQHALPLFWFRR